MERARWYIGCAGWALPRAVRAEFGPGDSNLARYATRLGAAEINSSFYRPHATATYRRWADSTPDNFRFSVKLPRAITHERRLVGCEHLLDEFLAQASGLGPRLGSLLVQLPPSLPLEGRSARRFLRSLRQRWAGAVAIEPRHASWFTAQAQDMLAASGVARVLADPVRHEAGAWPGGIAHLAYLRLHGSPRMYYTPYEPSLIAALARRIALALESGVTVWCVFDNTASGAAADNALRLAQALGALKEKTE
ncbi:MAG: DUF72 domain-containing protein [Ramlibacter sp.]